MLPMQPIDVSPNTTRLKPRVAGDVKMAVLSPNPAERPPAKAAPPVTTVVNCDPCGSLTESCRSSPICLILGPSWSNWFSSEDEKNSGGRSLLLLLFGFEFIFSFLFPPCGSLSLDVLGPNLQRHFRVNQT